MLPSLARTSEVDQLNDFDSAFNDGVHAQDNDPTTRKMPVFSSGFIVRVLTSDVSLQIETVDQQFTFDFTFKEVTSVVSLQIETVDQQFILDFIFKEVTSVVSLQVETVVQQFILDFTSEELTS